MEPRFLIGLEKKYLLLDTRVTVSLLISQSLFLSHSLAHNVCESNSKIRSKMSNEVGFKHMLNAPSRKV